MKAWPLAALLLLAACQREPARLRQVPSRMLWAWESPQDLHFLDDRTGVAFLAGELHLAKGAAEWRPRRNPLKVNPDTWLTAVLRIESAAGDALSPAQREAFLQACERLVRLPGVRGLQVDFDARRSERDWYREALDALRRRMPEGMPLSITALASWCWEEAWIRDLPVDEAVPMLFRMGLGEAEVRRRLERKTPFAVPLAWHSLGLSTDEPLPRLPYRKRLYVFHPGPWTAGDWQTVRARLEP